MISRKLYLAIGVLLSIFNINLSKAQETNVGLAINEYCAANVNGPADNFGIMSDWVEILNVDPNPRSLNGYFLSNDRNNLKKWPFPNGITLKPGEMITVWLSGRTGLSGGQYHANFTLDQCKTQYLSLTFGDNLPTDSTIVQIAKAGHSRGRIAYSEKGQKEFRLFTQPSYGQPNSPTNYYIDYVVKPTLVPEPTPTVMPVGASLTALSTGSFVDGGAGQIYKIKINGIDYDTANAEHKCFDVFYTTGGDYPNPGNWTRYVTPTDPVITVAQTDVVRVIAVPAATVNPGVSCPSRSLASFVETNTYFIDAPHQLFDTRFSVMSLTIDKADKNWFLSQGLPSSTTVHVEYFDKKKQISEGYAILNRPPQESWIGTQKGFYISIDDRYGNGCDFQGPIFNCQQLGVSSRTLFPTLHVKAGDFESAAPLNSIAGSTTQGTAMREVLMQSLVLLNDIKINALHIKPMIMFVNGKYWGVYNLTEVYDKHYENFYNGQPLDQLDLAYYHNGDASISYPDGSISISNNSSSFKSGVYNQAVGGPMTDQARYNRVMAQLDKESFTDYMILNNYAVNTDLFNFNIAFARGNDTKKPGSKWHYYLWNTPAVFSYGGVVNNTLTLNVANTSPCFLSSLAGYEVSPRAHNGHGRILSSLMHVNTGNPTFKADYRTRYVDLLNGPLKCENILRLFDTIYNLYKTEMRCHEDPACAAGKGEFTYDTYIWDSNMVNLRKKINIRCNDMKDAFSNAKYSSCFGRLVGPHNITVDVRPAGAGRVQFNTMMLPSYPWTGAYYTGSITVSASTLASNYVFDHWEFKNHTPRTSTLSPTAIADISMADEIVAVFTDLNNPIAVSGENANIPNAFTPNDDGLNDSFRPLGSGRFVLEYQMTIWNRWGQEVFRSTDPKGNGWDGNFNGEKAPTGVYAYVITYKDTNGEAKVAKGNVTLTR